MSSSGKGIWFWLCIVVALVAMLGYGNRRSISGLATSSELSVDGLFLGRTREELRSFGWQENTGAWHDVYVNGVRLWRRESPLHSIGWQKDRSCSISGGVLCLGERPLLSRGDRVSELSGLTEGLEWNEVDRTASTVEWKTPDGTYVAAFFPDGSTCNFVSISGTSHGWTAQTQK
jgi:hypothetical protein